MKMPSHSDTKLITCTKLITAAAVSLLLAACATPPGKPEGADNARMKLAKLQADPQLASRAPLAIKEAETAVSNAEQPQRDVEEGKHLVFIADHKVDIAAAQAQTRLLVDQRKTLSEQREKARLDSRTREADKAHDDATVARNDADGARRQSEDLQKQLDALNAKATDRGLVITLGDVLFDTARAQLKSGATMHLGKLAAFLNQYPDRTVTIEGYTDSVGSEDYNLDLSQRRADSVRAFLVGQGIAANRLVTSGKGEDAPVASNDSAAGRQQNRRVEVVIANTTTSMK